MLRQSGEVEASAEVMADMNELVKAPELTKAVKKMAKQLQKVKTMSSRFFCIACYCPESRDAAADCTKLSIKLSISLHHTVWPKFQINCIIMSRANFCFRPMAHDPSFLSKLLVSETRCSILSKFLVPNESGTRMHDRLSKFLIRDYGTVTWAENLGRVSWALDWATENVRHWKVK